jgi:hypothetical protein
MIEVTVYDDECQTASEIFKCGLEKENTVTMNVYGANVGNLTEVTRTIYSASSDSKYLILSKYGPPMPCVPIHRTCHVTNTYPCVRNVCYKSFVDICAFQSNRFATRKASF